MRLKNILYDQLGGRLIVRLLWLLFSLLPLNKKKIVCQSFNGRGYSDNPRAIINEILRQGLDYTIVWLVRDDAEGLDLPKGVIPVKASTLASVFHMSTAMFWIDNTRKLSYVRKRRGQLYIQTWHGFPLKRIENDVVTKLNSTYVERARNDSEMCDLMISNSSFLTSLYKKSFWYSGEVLECGSPRNDMLINADDSAIFSVRQRMAVEADKKILLYAPTFRSDKSLKAYDLDVQDILSQFRKKFGSDWVLAIRLHPNIAEKSKDLISGRRIKDVSDYPDTQDLLLAADALITDYSSVMFDFMLTGKPCFLYANDISDYMKDRGFYYDISDLPYPMAETRLSLTEAIQQYDQVYARKRINMFIDKFGIQENGIASEAVVRWMSERRSK